MGNLYRRSTDTPYVQSSSATLVLDLASGSAELMQSQSHLPLQSRRRNIFTLHLKWESRTQPIRMDLVFKTCLSRPLSYLPSIRPWSFTMGRLPCVDGHTPEVIDISFLLCSTVLCYSVISQILLRYFTIGGHWPERVEVSGDGGSVWYETPYEKLSTKYYHAWRLWEIELPVDAEGWLELCVRFVHVILMHRSRS